MKLLYIADNRDQPNWGCRATSIALDQLLSREHEIIYRVFRKLFLTKTPTRSLLPFPLSRKVYNFAKGRKLLGQALQFEKLYGCRDDVVFEDPVKTAKTIVRVAKRDSEFQEILEAIEECDALVVNGEGEMIFTTPPRRSLLFLLGLMQLSIDKKKPVNYVNAMVSSCPFTGQNKKTAQYATDILSKCHSVAVRDKISFKNVKGLSSDINVKYVPDALFSWNTYTKTPNALPPQLSHIVPFKAETNFIWKSKFSFNTPYVAICGGSAAAKNSQKAFDSYLNLAKLIQSANHRPLFIQACSGDNFIQRVAITLGIPYVPVETPIMLCCHVLANASVFITGRYHPAIMASLGGTPCVFLGSNSHKTISLQSVLEYDNPKEFSAYPSNTECQEILSRTEKYMEEGNTRRKEIGTRVDRLSIDSLGVLDLL